MPPRPRSAFRQAARSLVLAFGLAAGAASGQASSATMAPIAPQPFTTLPGRAQPVALAPTVMPASRPLSEGEKKLLHTLFGADAPVDDLQFAFDRGTANDNAGNSDDGKIHVQDPRLFSRDYSAEADPYLFGYFVNRMTGEMQRLKGDSWQADANGSGSFYTVGGEGYSFASYGREQQRAIMEDYALRFLHPTRQSYWLSRMYGGDRSITDPYLITTVEKAFPSATKGRTDYQHIILRRLTTGEVKLIRTIFGDQFDTADVWVHLSPTAYRDVAGAVASSHEVYFYGRNRSNDFSQEDVQKLSIFLHEMTHIWQFQTDRRFTVVVNDQYKYAVADGARFADYNIEQQAAMIEDYVLYHLLPDHKMRWLPMSCTAQELDAKTQTMLAVVETFFEGARNLAPVPRTAPKAPEATHDDTAEPPAETTDTPPAAKPGVQPSVQTAVQPSLQPAAPKPPAA